MTPEQTAIATARYIEGQSTREIAPQVGAHWTTVARDLRRPEVRAKIEAAANQIINRGLKPSVNTLCRLAAKGNTKYADKDTLKLALDASKHITSIAGLSGNAPSTVINALIQVNQAPEQGQELTDIQRFLSHTWGQPAIDLTDTTHQTSCKESMMTGVPTSHTAPSEAALQAVEDTPNQSISREDRATITEIQGDEAR